MTKYITDKELEELLKVHKPKAILYMYTMYKINLRSKQIDKLIELKNKGGKMTTKNDIVFTKFKDSPTNGKDSFKKSVKKYIHEINVDEVYRRIVNYQIEKYGRTLDDRYDSLNYFQKQNMSGNSSRRRKLNEHKKGCGE